MQGLRNRLIALSKTAGAFARVRRVFATPLCSPDVAPIGRADDTKTQAQNCEALQQAYEALRQSQQAVVQQERLRALEQVSSAIAHDINNILSPAALYAELLLERETLLSDEGRTQLNAVRRAIDDIAHTVSRMREVYGQRPQPQLSRIDLNRCVEHVIELTHARWRDSSQERGIAIEFSCDLAPSLPSVPGVESEVTDALTNLVFNAIDAMPRGGILTMRTRVSSGREAWPANMSSVHVDVSDTGVGMDTETRQRCMEPFFTTKGDRGAGLGLAMVYGMANRHGADLEIESVPGAGTTVRLTFATGAVEHARRGKAT